MLIAGEREYQRLHQRGHDAKGDGLAGDLDALNR
jgi:hypothetical protein